MTEAQARQLAKRDRGYYARKLRGQWMVWDNVSDHHVDFDGYSIDDMIAEDLYREKENDMQRPDAVALDIARALAEPLTGFDFDDLLENQQDELLGAAWAAMNFLERAAANREPLDPMRGVDFPFADNH